MDKRLFGIRAGFLACALVILGVLLVVVEPRLRLTPDTCNNLLIRYNEPDIAEELDGWKYYTYGENGELGMSQFSDTYLYLYDWQSDTAVKYYRNILHQQADLRFITVPLLTENVQPSEDWETIVRTESEIDQIRAYMDEHGEDAAMKQYQLTCITASDGVKFYQ